MNRFYQFVVAFFLCSSLLVAVDSAHSRELSAQTNVDQAAHSVDAAGVPTLSIDGVGAVAHPAWTALYALAYAGIEDYDPSLGLKPDAVRFQATIDWLKNNLVQDSNGLWVWVYNFDSTYNDVSIKAPWSSAFAQAVGIQALLAHWKQTGDEQSLEFARKAAQALFVPLEQGGFLFRSGDDIWFEEIPEPVNNPSHILNGHMRTLLALGELVDATGDEQYREWFKRGSDTLLRWLPLYDAGYWLRYDLNPRKEELLFRLANPYGFANPELAIDRIVLRDPVTGEESVLDVGGQSDAEGAVRIAGNDWGQVELLDGRTVRRLRSVIGERESLGGTGQMVAPFSYFYLALPKASKGSVSNKEYELVVEYFDEEKGNLSVQIRSIASGNESFKNLKYGDLFLSGEGRWRKWIVPLFETSLGYFTGTIYAEKHARYLNLLSEREPRFKSWGAVALGYLNSELKLDGYEVVAGVNTNSVRSTPLAPGYVLDSSGILQARLSSSSAKFLSDGNFDMSSDLFGRPVYHPFVIADQLLNGDSSERKQFVDPPVSELKREPALEWFLNKSNQHNSSGATTYHYDFDSSYNDVETLAPWASAFSQAYAIKALIYADRNLGADVEALVQDLIDAYSVSVEDGGLSTFNRSGLPFFEEVPNKTHILNAHILSINELYDAYLHFKSQDIKVSVDKGIAALKDVLDNFDAGYWMRYDQNPKKEIYFNIDWVSGDDSLVVDEISLANPISLTKTLIDVGAESSEEVSRIVGADWGAPVVVDGRSVRSFSNGYLRRAFPAEGGLRHNAFFVMALPEASFSELFDVPVHLLRIRYKDLSPGVFSVNVQAINDGSKIAFVPLRGGRLSTVGDNKWKEAVFIVRPQDMGWYKGADYQKYEVEQLERLAAFSNDEFLSQFAERQKYFYQERVEGRSVIVYPEPPGLVSDSKVSPVSVVASSGTYPGYSFDNSLDGVFDDDYTAGLEGQGENFVVLSFPKRLGRFKISMTSESDDNYPINIRTYESDSSGKKIAELSSLGGNSSSRLEYVVEAERPVDFVRIEFQGFSGQPRVLLRLIEVFEVYDGAEDSKSDTLYLPAGSDSNPLGIFGYSVMRSLKDLSDRLASGAETDHEKVLKFMSYIDAFGVGTPSSGSPDVVVREKVGACGEFTNVLLGLAAAQGMEGRYVNLYNYPEGDGHTVAEIKVDGRWVLYDPSYSAYYTSVLGSEREALSFDQIVSRYRSGDEVFPVIRNSRSGSDRFTGKNIFTKAYPLGVIGPDKPMFFPLTLDFNGKKSLNEKEFGAKFQGADFIGVASTNQQQNWFFDGLIPGREYSFEITVKGLSGNFIAGDDVFVLRAMIYESNGAFREVSYEFNSLNSSSQTFRISFVATSSRQNLALVHDYSGPEYRYIRMQHYELSQLN